MATKVVILNNLIVQYDDTKYADTFNEKVGGTMVGEIIKKADNTATITFFDTQVVKINQDLITINPTIAAIGNMTKITLS